MKEGNKPCRKKGIKTGSVLTWTAVLVLVATVAAVGAYHFAGQEEKNSRSHTEAENFSSLEELQRYVQRDSTFALVARGTFGRAAHYGVILQAKLAGKGMSLAPKSAETNKATGKIEHSTTNVQVKGVGEADVVKSDGEFMYAVSGKRVAIVKAYPPREIKIASKIQAEGDIMTSIVKL